MRLGYITTGYPYVSHTFIQNEVLALRELGLQIDTFTVRQAPASECRTPADRDARRTTYALRPPRFAHYLRAHACALRTRPAICLRALVRSVRLGGGSPERLLHHLAYYVQAVVLWHRCRGAGIGHLHAHFANVSSDVAMLASMIGGPQLSWSYTMHGPTEFYDVGRYHLAEKVRDARFVVCVSDFARSQLMGITTPDQWEKLHVIHCGVDLERFSPRGRRVAPERLVVTCVGRLVPEKGQSLLIQSIASMRRAGHPVQLTVVGDGPERESLRALAAKLGLGADVSFLGAVAHTQVDEVLRRTDIFCLPSFAEGVPIVLMEAMALGLPVISTRVMGIPELVQDGVSGRLVSPGSADELGRAIAELAADPDLRYRFGVAARERVASEFDLRANAVSLRRLYLDQLCHSSSNQNDAP